MVGVQSLDGPISPREGGRKRREGRDAGLVSVNYCTVTYSTSVAHRFKHVPETVLWILNVKLCFKCIL